MIVVGLALLLAVVLVGLGVTTITAGRRASEGGPRWAVTLAFLLGIELTLFGVALIMALAHAYVVYAQAG
ncbi:MAG: hypothetical protein ACXWUG_05930 [Polyangiales bacterium]